MNQDFGTLSHLMRRSARCAVHEGQRVDVQCIALSLCVLTALIQWTTQSHLDAITAVKCNKQVSPLTEHSCHECITSFLPRFSCRRTSASFMVISLALCATLRSKNLPPSTANFSPDGPYLPWKALMEKDLEAMSKRDGMTAEECARQIANVSLKTKPSWLCCVNFVWWQRVVIAVLPKMVLDAFLTQPVKPALLK